MIIITLSYFSISSFNSEVNYYPSNMFTYGVKFLNLNFGNERYKMIFSLLGIQSFLGEEIIRDGNSIKIKYGHMFSLLPLSIKIKPTFKLDYSFLRRGYLNIDFYFSKGNIEEDYISEGNFGEIYHVYFLSPDIYIKLGFETPILNILNTELTLEIGNAFLFYPFVNSNIQNVLYKPYLS